PVAQPSSVTTNEDTVKTFALSDFLFNDVEGDSLVSITIGSLALASGDTLTVDQGAGQIAVVNGMTVTAAQLTSLTYTPAANANGSVRSTFSFTVNDVDAGTVAATMTINVTAVNDSPTDLALSANAVAENQPVGTAVGIFTTSDPDTGDSFTYALVSGSGSTDNASFQISNDELETNAVLDFESQSSYSIRVRSTDAGGLSIEKVFTITATDVNDAPSDVTLSNNTIAENQPAGTTVGSFTTTDQDLGDSFTYSLVSGSGSSDNSLFQIVGNALQINASLDFEVQSTYSVRIHTTDAGGLTFEKVFTIFVTDVNDRPTDLNLSSTTEAEDQPVGTPIGTFSIVDEDAGDTFTYALVPSSGSADNARFRIVGGVLQTNAVLNFEAQATYSIRVRTTDAGGLTFEKSLTITATNVNETPVDLQLSSSTLPEEQPVGTVIGTLSTTDPDVGDTFTYSLVIGTGSSDNALFQITGNTLQTNAILNFETQQTYSIRIRTTDAGGLMTEKTFVITVSNVNEAPTSLTLSNDTLAERQPIGTPVGTFSSTDPDSGSVFTYSLVSGVGASDNLFFKIVGGTLETNAVLDFNTQPIYSIRVRTTDAGGLSFENVFTITLTSINKAPTDLELSSNTIAENQPSGTAIGTFSSTDPDSGDTFTYSLVPGVGSTDNAAFQIVGGQLQSSAVFNFETQSSYSIRVRTTDAGGLTFERVFSVSVTDVNEAPSDIALSPSTVAENQAADTAFGIFSTIDPDAGDMFTYILVPGTGATDNSQFRVIGNILQTAESLDFETQSSYSIRIRTTDAGGLSTEKVFTVQVTNINESPTALTLSASSIAENQPVGLIVGTFATTDPDIGDTFTYTLITGIGSDDNASFAIVGNTLKTAAVLNFEVQATYSIRVRTTDSGGLTVEKVFSISATNVDEAPTDLNLAGTTVAENQPVGTTIGTLTTADPDQGDTFNYSLVTGTGSSNNALFQIVGSSLQTNAILNFEAQSSYSVRIRSTDAGGLTIEKSFVVTATNVNEAPTDLALSNNILAENQPIGTVIGTFTTTDPDVGETFTYALVFGVGSTDNAAFKIVGNALQVNSILSFAAQSIYSVRVQSTDVGGLTIQKTFTINLTSATNNHAPSDLTLSANHVSENLPVGTLIGALTTSDPDVGDTFTYSLVSGTAGTDNDLFQIVGNTLQTNAVFDFETKSSYTVRIRITDAGGLTADKVFTILIDDADDPPLVTLTTGSTTTLTGKHIAVDSGATIVDPDTPDLKNDRIVVTIKEGDQTPDQLRLISNGKGADKLKVAGGHLKLGKTSLGTVTGGKKGEPLTISFDTDVTNELAQRVIRNISFQTHRSNTGTRKIDIQVFDASGNSNLPSTKTVVVGNPV
ncbi:MAG: cya 3, partial [Planctomycetaceae bacterium]|nr:cya 3 [Planctomycetaceae bacterium]